MTTEYAIAYLNLDGNIMALERGYWTLADVQRHRDCLKAMWRPRTRIMRRHIGPWEKA